MLSFLPLIATCALLAQASPTEELKLNPLTPEEARIILDKGTEYPFTGEYNKHYEPGTYICRQCDAPLYKSTSKFDSGCGWPSFDDEIKGAVKRVPDADGRRVEIVCMRCDGHLGHVFLNEGFTLKQTRHCVNSLSIKFVPEKVEVEEKEGAASAEPETEAEAEPETERAIFAGGCFWGVEIYLEKVEGVHDARSGYIGGHKDNPTYQEVCSGTTGHIEAVEVIYDPRKTDFETLARLFFEIHDPTQVNRQGPDIGEQYKSAIFYLNDEQKEISQKLITLLEEKGYKVATELRKATKFWVAEEYHQDYYERKQTQPYCHFYTKRF